MSKIRRYEAAGIKLIWVINPVAKEALVYVPGQLDAVETLGINDELDGKDIIPGFKLRLETFSPHPSQNNIGYKTGDSLYGYKWQ